MNKQMKSVTLHALRAFPSFARIGYYLSLLSITLLMIGIGFFKFTPAEAAGIRPLVENHFPFTK